MQMEHFNKLTPAEAERLAMLAEEAGEIVQIVGKILRHGYDNHHPDNPAVTNRKLLEKEINDLVTVITMMEGEIAPIYGMDTEALIKRKLRYAHHQEEWDSCK